MIHLTLVFSGYDPESGLPGSRQYHPCNVDDQCSGIWKNDDVAVSQVPAQLSQHQIQRHQHGIDATDRLAKLLTENFCNTNLGNVYDESAVATTL